MSKSKLINLRPSQASFWMNCSYYIHSKSVKDPFENRSEASLGHIVHKLMDRLVEYAHVDNLWKKGFPTKYYHDLLSGDLLNAKESALYLDNKIETYRYCLMSFTRIAGDVQYLIDQYRWGNIGVRTEQHFKYIGGNFFLSGTADVLIFTPESLHVYDYKTGMIEVEAEDNEQLSAYAHLAAQKYKNKYDAVHVCIIQPSTNSVTSDTIQIDPDYFQNIEKKVKDKKANTGSHCTYCDIWDVCPSLRKKIEEYKKVELPDNGLIDRLEIWAELLEIEPVITKLFKAVKERSKEYIYRGEEIPGWEVYRKNTARKWIEGISPNEIARALKLKRNEVIEESLKTPKAVEEMINEKQLETFNAFVVNPSTPVLRKIKD